MSIPTMLASRFPFGSLILWGLLALRGNLELLRGRALFVAVGICGVAPGHSFDFWTDRE